ncbi:hypothetical protein [Candidatus Synechococcus spongiarum]|uniref:hypothetical protein n=1 Tax=Candidatus Synechococcus spongiarum TaxID=431041 RepID=UPI0011775D87|nr:hypothetical protein [Candidatus Synechococcus spongiarum]
MQQDDLQYPCGQVRRCTGNHQPPATIASAGETWWRQWLGPVVAAAVISVLVIALVTVGVAGFNSLKGDVRNLKSDMREMGTMLGRQIEMLKLDSKARLREDIKDLKADNRSLNDKLDRLLEGFLASRT